MNDAYQHALASGRTIIGVDEVGRGAWAGPVVAAAVILPPATALAGVRDSKLMTPRSRQSANRMIRAHAIAIGIGWVGAGEVDANGLAWAIKQSGMRALEALAPSGAQSLNSFVVLDGRHNYLRGTHYDSTAIVKADDLIASVSAASVIAKVARDQYLVALSRAYPDYGFAQHKGYGTTLHAAAISTYGPSPQHRRSVAPIAAALASKATEAEE